ncbi:hypothetical protein FPSE_10855 [Fusarium pseudograminearum CS3096]|uniref:Uncharacterized protein n=1 Tax=Fusarium pseudograminearum (strain CS3096) TaxID=1028729 RepID=K3VXH9_FUSPC|nr:hypothetical protein FPSE_10855 [Fusarium pseudograminearum CS3096]EKJ68930.1 hypothetical protein FPSE_10855 [Fusarium pseudograminearum CS3096]
MNRHQADNENSQELILAIIATCVSVAVFVVSLRFYVRLVIIRKFGPDDWALAAALVATIFGGAIMGVSVRRADPYNAAATTKDPAFTVGTEGGVDGGFLSGLFIVWAMEETVFKSE